MKPAVSSVSLIAIVVFFITLHHQPTALAVPAWGDAGHQLVALIAENLISSSTQQQVSNLLSGQTLVDVATWADSVKKEPAYEWSAKLHYVDTQNWECNYDHSTDCSDNNCVVGAITNYTTRLRTLPSGPQRNEALKFITHFVGDVHQPLHVGFAGDEGGNRIEGYFYSTRVNLHAIWDSSIIEKRINDDFSGSQDQYGQYLIQQIQGPWSNQAQQWASCASYECGSDWAVESAGDACQYSYVDADGVSHLQSGFHVEDAYYQRNSPIVDTRLAAAGVRLGALLDKVFSSSTHATSDSVAVFDLPNNKV